MKKVLITGANGYVASSIIPHLEKKFELTLVDIEFNKKFNSKTIEFDISNSPIEELDQISKNHDAIIHLAYIKSENSKDPNNISKEIEFFDTENQNIIMANKIYRTAHNNNLSRVIVASSNHAADWYEHYEIHTNVRDMVSNKLIPYSDNFYGWAKASYELLSIPYASGKFGKKLEFVHVRIGFPREITADISDNKFIPGAKGTGIPNLKRHLGAYISQRDLSQLFEKSLNKEEIIGNIEGVPFLVVYGVSNNTRRFWSLESGRKALGYEPKDDSEYKFSELINVYKNNPEWEGRLG